MLKAQAASLRELLQGERQLTHAETAVANAALATADDALLQAREIVAATAGGGTTGAWPYNRPCAQQYVGKSQSCMVTSGRGTEPGLLSSPTLEYVEAWDGLVSSFTQQLRAAQMRGALLLHANSALEAQLAVAQDQVRAHIIGRARASIV